MIIASYTDLRTAIADYLAKSNLTQSIPGFVQLWEERFLRQPRNYGRWMEASLSATIGSGVISLPSGYLELKYAYLNGSPASKLDRVSLNQLYGRYPRGSGTGRPVWIARDTTNFVFGPEPDAGYEVRGVYFAKPQRIREADSDAATHWIIVNAPDLALYGALLEAQPYLLRDSRIPTWKALYDMALQDYRDQQRSENFSGSPVQEVLA